MKAHPAADLFPMMSDEEIGQLAVDIRTNGLRQPIVTIDENGDRLILDGRNRDRACAIAGVPKAYIPFGGDDPYAFVVSANLHRRHLSPTERAFLAERLANLKGGRPRSRTPSSGEVSRRQVASLLQVSTTAIDRVRQINSMGVPGLVASVREEQISLSAAAKLAALPPEEQHAMLAAGAEAVAAWSTETQRLRRNVSSPKRVFMHDDKPAKEIRPGLVLVKPLESSTPITGSWEERTETARKLARDGWTAEDIAQHTGIRKSTLRKLIKDHRPHRNVLEGAVDDVSSFAEAWDRYARSLPTQWSSATKEEWTQLSNALKAASKAAMKMVRRLNKEATEVNDEAREAEAE